jgi:hypothetical protein
MSEPPRHVEEFRAAYQREVLGPRYNGWLHLAVIAGSALAALVFAATRVHAPSALEWLAVPITLVIANLGEYLGHRGPMHHKRRGLTLLFKRHTQQHHRYYTTQAMAVRSHRDFHMVLFPPVMLFFFLGLLAAPIGALFYWLISPNVGWLFVATAAGNYLFYEFSHLMHHWPPESRLGGSALFRWLRRHHATHHDPSRMVESNFNITLPLCDWLFGTFDREVRDRSVAAPPRASRS